MTGELVTEKQRAEEKMNKWKEKVSEWRKKVE